MASRHFKRPSSARRNINQETFSPYISSSRLRNVQSLLKKGEDNLDAILCIQGIDSRYNEGALELINYLLFNFFDSRKMEIEKSPFAEEVVDDMMFLIRENSVDIYCNPINYHYLLPYVAHWRNLHFHCLKDQVYEDTEKAEEFKIQSFVVMTDTCKKVGIPYFAKGQNTSEKFEVMTVEKWPIVQAYALEGFGNGGFFTMEHQVSDISEQLHNLYNLMDPVALETIVTEKLPLFERQWSTLISNVDLDAPNKCLKITERKISEPLQTYFTHGRPTAAKGTRGSQRNSRSPFVLFGCNSGWQFMENLQKTVISSDASRPNAGINGKQAQHMVCQAVSPRGPICCRRTYFFTQAVFPFPLSQTQEEQTQNFDKSDVRILQLVYNACIDAVQASMHTYAKTLSVKKAEAIARHALVETCEKTRPKIRPKHLVGKDSVHFSLKAYDNQSNVVPIEDGVCCRHVKTVTMTVCDIPSVEHPGHTIGSVSFGESFLESVVHVSLPDGREKIDAQILTLTSHIPKHAAWPCGLEHDSVNAVQEHILNASTFSSAMGRALVSGERAQLLNNTESIRQDGALHLYENGLIYLHPHMCPIVLPKSQMSSIHFYDGDSSSVVALLIITYKETVRPHLPTYLTQTTPQLIFSFQPKTKLYKAWFSEVLPVWKDAEAQPKLQTIDALPEELIEIHTELQNGFKLLSIPHRTPLQQAKTKLAALESFLPHFECSSVGGDVAIPSKHLPVALGMDWDVGHFNDSQDKLIITVITGSPGIGKHALCTTLKKNSDWEILLKEDNGGNDANEFSTSKLQASVTSVWKKRKAKPGEMGKVRALLAIPGFVDTVDVVQALVTHPDKEVVANTKIGAVTACLDPESFFITDHFTFPKLLDQCAQGWINNVIFSTQENTKTSQLNRVQCLVRAVNSDVALLLADKGEVTRSTDLALVLSEEAFEYSSLLRARYLSCPGWHNGSFSVGPSLPKLEQKTLRFSLPLDKFRLFNKLRGLKGTINEKYPFLGSIYHVKGLVHFTDSKSSVPQQYNLNYSTLGDVLSLTPSSSSPPNIISKQHRAPAYVIFYGCQLQEDQLKDWLRAAGPQQPEKRVKRTRASLTKAEINRIHKEHHLDSLPEGWFYNGSKFVSLASEKSDTHPNLEQFLRDYLLKINKDVDIFNANIDKTNFQDLFS